jgi:ATP-binding protein involved in chromosome partitioning
LLGEIPLDPLVCQASDRGEPMVTAHPDSPMAEAFRYAAEAITAQVNAAAGAGPMIRMDA